MTFALLIVALIGLVDSAFAWYLSRRPTVVACAVGDGETPACPTLFQSETAHLIGKTPNSMLGTTYFGLLLIYSLLLLGDVAMPGWVLPAAILASFAATEMSFYLFWHLVFVRHERCLVCYIGHAASFGSLLCLGALTRS